MKVLFLQKHMIRFLNKQYCKAVKDAILESEKWGPTLCPTDKSFNFSKSHFLHLYNEGDKNICPPETVDN